MPNGDPHRGRRASDIGPWTVAALKEYVDVLWADHKQVHEVGLRTLEDRLQALNELRQMVVDAQSKFLARDTYDSAHSALEARMRLVENRESLSSGASDQARWLVGVLGIIAGGGVGALIGHFLK